MCHSCTAYCIWRVISSFSNLNDLVLLVSFAMFSCIMTVHPCIRRGKFTIREFCFTMFSCMMTVHSFIRRDLIFFHCVLMYDDTLVLTRRGFLFVFLNLFVFVFSFFSAMFSFNMMIHSCIHRGKFHNIFGCVAKHS